MNGTAHALSTSRTLWELLGRRAGTSSRLPALIQAGDTPDEDRTTTFGELRDRVLRTAAGLYAHGVRPGDRFAWQLPTRTETVVLSLALARLGAVQTPVIPFYRDREVCLALRASTARYFAHPGQWRGFDHGAMTERIRPALGRPLDVLTQLPDGDPAVLPEAPADGTDVRWIYWTSGTTSDPRGVLHTDRSLIAGGSCLGHALCPRPDDVGSVAFPYAHIGGPDYLVMMLLYGFPAVLFEKFALPDSLDAYRRLGVTLAGGSTAFYSMFLAEQRKQPGRKLIPSLRLLAGGGAAKPPELYYEVVRELDCQLTHGYGMTEAPMITIGTPDDSTENLATTEGRPPEAMEIRITGPDGTPLPPGVDGEVRLRGEAVCKGYLDAPQGTGAASETFDSDGFLLTGDLGHLTAEGYLVLTGRQKEIIIRKGENISAKEIEQLLYEHPAVGDVAVIALPDAERGERVCAVVEQPPGTVALTLREVTSYLSAEGLSPHKLPEQLEVVEALPRNETLRKVLKYKLQERFSE